MPTQLQLEGPELEPLLARVRAEHGAGARIVSAEKVRIGGLGGFFAKAHFEITVEVEDTAPAAAAPAPVAAPRVTSILDLADEVSAVERSAAAAVSTETTGFAAVLARLGATAGEPASTAQPARPEPVSASPLIPQQRRATSPTTRPAPRPRADVVAPAASAATPRRRRTDARPAAAPVRAASTRRSAPAAPAAVGSTAVRTVRAPGAVAARPGTAVAVRTGSAVAVRPRSTVAARPGSAVAVRRAAAPAPAAPAKPARTAVARSAGLLATAARQIEPAESVVQAQLAQLGLPAHLQPAAAEDRLYPALVESLRALPKPPTARDRAGTVLAVVGPLPHATEVARQLARELDLPRTAVVVGASTLRTPQQARTHRETWSRRSRTTIVVLDTPLSAAGALRSRALLDALEPTSTWGVVEATRKPRDVGAWSRAVGRIDALALTGVDETADPASVLQLGIPVARLDTRKATAAAWATLLTSRVAA